MTHWIRQKYCKPCAQAEMRGSNLADVAARAASQNAAISEIHASVGKQKTNLLDGMEYPEYAWIVAFSVPYSISASKNGRFGFRNGTGLFVTRDSRTFAAEVEAATRSAIKGVRVAHNKLWLSFFVEKENQKSDAVNVVDTMCDAIKRAVELDDRWFCIDRVDWCVKKTDPRIVIRIGQTTTEDAIVCSHCGQIKPLDLFTRHKGNPLGRGRVCDECRPILQKHAKRERRSA